MAEKIALALGGGGARGLAHFGVMEYLSERKVQVTAVAGTSMGAIAGAAIAAGDWRRLAEGYARLDWMKLLPMMDITLSGSGLLDGQKALEFLRAHIPAETIEQLTLPYAAVAANLTRRRKEVFTHGDLFYAMRASFAIPGVFTPVVTDNGELLVDGGLVELVPFITARSLSDAPVLAVGVNGFLAKQDEPPLSAPPRSTDRLERLYGQLREMKVLNESDWGRKVLAWFRMELNKDRPDLPGLFELTGDVIDFMQEELLRMQLERHPPDWIVTPNLSEFGIWDYHKAEALIQAGYDAARAQLPF